MVFQAAKLAVIKDDKSVEHRVAECQLVLDPFRLDLAHELGEEVALHCYTEHGALRPEINSLTLNPRVPNQRMTVKGATGAAGREITDVEVLGMTVARQADEKTGEEWLKATIRCRFDFAPKSHRDWITMYFGMGGFFSFDAEKLSLTDTPSEPAA